MGFILTVVNSSGFLQKEEGGTGREDDALVEPCKETTNVGSL